MTEWVPVLIVILFSAAVGGGMWLMGTVLGPRRSSAEKDAPFECGNPSYGTGQRRFAARYYLVALLFLIFDVEAVFLYPWAVLFRRLGWFGLTEMALFGSVLLVAYLYAWRKGALEWD